MESVVDKILNNILPFVQAPAVDIVTSYKLDKLSEKINQIYQSVNDPEKEKTINELTSMVKELHTVQTGYNFKPKTKKPTRKQLEEEEDLRARQFAHQKKLNK